VAKARTLRKEVALRLKTRIEARIVIEDMRIQKGGGGKEAKRGVEGRSLSKEKQMLRISMWADTLSLRTSPLDRSPRRWVESRSPSQRAWKAKAFLFIYLATGTRRAIDEVKR
jgi:hypothetical protein